MFCHLNDHETVIRVLIASFLRFVGIESPISSSGEVLHILIQ